MPDQKISALTADASPTSDDLLVTVDNPAGTPANRKVSIASVAATIQPLLTINVATQVTGDLPFANLAQGSALSVLGVTGNATADNASITAGTDKQVLRRSGTAIAFGAVDLASSVAVTGVLPIARFATGTPDGTKFVRDDGALAVPPIANDAVTYAKIQNISAATRLLGRGTAAGSGDVEEVTLGAGMSMAGTVLSSTVVGIGVVLPSTIEGRLTTESGVPLSTTDRTAQSTLYYTPSASNGMATTNGNISLYNGSALLNVAFTELSLTLSGLTSGKNYDVFVDYNAGTPQLVLSVAWTNDTTRADALGVQSGIVIKSGTAAYRWVGTIRTTGTTTTEDSGGITGTTQVGGKRYVWNAYNQVPRTLSVIDTTDSWAYTTNTIRQAGGATGNKVEYVSGSASALVDATVLAGVSVFNNTVAAKAGVGVDSTTTFSGLVGLAFSGAAGTATILSMSGMYSGTPGLGYHYLSWNEKGANNNSTFTGDDGADSSQSGLIARIWN